MTLDNVHKSERIKHTLYVFFQTCQIEDTSGMAPAFAYTSSSEQVTAEFDINGSFVERTFKPAHLSRSNIRRTEDETADSVTVSFGLQIEPFKSISKRMLTEDVECEIYEVFADSAQSVYTEPQLIFRGSSLNVSQKATSYSVTFVSFDNRLRNECPTRMLSQSCRHKLYDCQTCKLDEDDWTFTGTVARIGSGRNKIWVEFTPDEPVEKQFIGGTIYFTVTDLGTPLTFSLSITHDKTTSDTERRFIVMGHVPSQIQVGDSVSASYGCNRRFGSNCRDVFGNTKNFGGDPVVRSRNPATDNLVG